MELLKIAQPLPPIVDADARCMREQPAAGRHVAEAVHLCGSPAGIAPGDASLDRRSACIPRTGAQDARVPSGAQRRRAVAPASGDPQGNGRPRGVPEPLPVWGDRVRPAGTEGTAGFVGSYPLETLGSGGQDTRCGEYEEILDLGRDEEVAHVMIIDVIYDSIKFLMIEIAQG